MGLEYKIFSYAAFHSLILDVMTVFTLSLGVFVQTNLLQVHKSTSYKYLSRYKYDKKKMKHIIMNEIITYFNFF